MSTTLPALLPDASTPERDGAARTYLVKTLGCQMNVHDSEHMAGMLEQAGYVAASPVQAAAEDADVIVINTCAVRENAADKLYGNLGRLAASKRARPGMQIAVGAVSRRRTVPGSSSGRRGSTWCSARTTSTSCPCCWNAPATTPRPRSRSRSR